MSELDDLRIRQANGEKMTFLELAVANSTGTMIAGRAAAELTGLQIDLQAHKEEVERLLDANEKLAHEIHNLIHKDTAVIVAAKVLAPMIHESGMEGETVWEIAVLNLEATLSAVEAK